MPDPTTNRPTAPNATSPRDYARDPVLATAQLLIEQGHRSVAEVLDLYEHKRATVMGLAKEVAQLPQLNSAAAVTEPLTTGLREAETRLTRQHPATSAAANR